MAYPQNTHPFYSSSTPSFYSTTTPTTTTTHTPPFPTYRYYNPSSFSTTTPITSPTPNLNFNHGYSPPSHSHTQKMAFPICMDVPIFYGLIDDAYEWVISIDKYLTVHGIPEAMKVTAAVMALRDHALKWWLWHSQNHPPANWESFKVAFLWHFKPKFRDDLLLDEEEESHPELTILEDEEKPMEQPDEKEPEPEPESVEEEESEEQRDGDGEIPDLDKFLRAENFSPLTMVKTSNTPFQLPKNSISETQSSCILRSEISCAANMITMMPKASFSASNTVIPIQNDSGIFCYEKSQITSDLIITLPPPKPPDPINSKGAPTLFAPLPAQSDENLRTNNCLQRFLHLFTPLDLKGFDELKSQPLNKNTAALMLLEASLNAPLAPCVQQQPLDLQRLAFKQSALSIQNTICGSWFHPNDLGHVSLPASHLFYSPAGHVLFKACFTAALIFAIITHISHRLLAAVLRLPTLHVNSAENFSIDVAVQSYISASIISTVYSFNESVTIFMAKENYSSFIPIKPFILHVIFNHLIALAVNTSPPISKTRHLGSHSHTHSLLIHSGLVFGRPLDQANFVVFWFCPITLKTLNCSCFKRWGLSDQVVPTTFKFLRFKQWDPS